jgi:hypothetical protein
MMVLRDGVFNKYTDRLYNGRVSLFGLIRYYVALWRNILYRCGSL